MRAILFPTDFSEIANNAFLYALHIAKSIDAKIYVLYTYLEPVLSATHGGQPELLGEVYQTIELNQFEIYKKKTQKLRDIAVEKGMQDVELLFLFEEGPVAPVVKNIVDREKIHLVVMGTHGESGFLSKLIGTNTVNVIKSIQNPVLAVPPHAVYQGIKRTVFTTLFRDKDKPALKEMLLMAKAVNAKIDCLHVLHNDRVADVLFQTEAWQKEFPDAEINYVLLDEVESIENTIANYILENNIDILGVVKRNRNFFDRLFNSSISNNLAFHSKVPILVFHEEK
ncbi:universal stress protein [Sphingobacterium endophyticum]|uniref:universal stress protein n=1 Tax=Sphingobacterium endophyticum TaxID=2546448 RepID=UPI0012E32842|nr:universal stress protein [Sphingobacterium endophyticum]